LSNNQSLIIENILNSQTFANKEVLKGLLRFLFEEGKAGRTLKETDIAIGYFKRGNGFIPGEDTIVRVTVYKLRTLLEKYYADEGKTNIERIELPKGTYTLQFKRKGDALIGGSRRRMYKKVLLVLLAISVLINIFFYFRLQPNKESKNPIWASYIKSGQAVYITLGDPFFYRIDDKNTGAGSLIIRDITINSKEALTQKSPKGFQQDRGGVSELNYPYFSRNNLWPLPTLISFFTKASLETRLHTLSETNIDDVKNNNVVFIANINSFRWMNKFLETTSLKLSDNPREIRINRGKHSLVLRVPELVNGSYTDYAILVKVPGPNKNPITLMGDFHASGLRGLTTFINKRESLRFLENQAKKRYGHFPEYFEMVVKVTSYNYSDFDTKLIYFKSLERMPH